MKRVQKEAGIIKSKSIPGIADIQINDANMKVWKFLVVPNAAPYDKGAFRASVTFPNEYPFSPPVLNFETKIYHPNVDEKGNVCLNIVNKEQWKPAETIENVLLSLVKLVEVPEPGHPLRTDLAKQYNDNRKEFMKMAADFTKKHGEVRPKAKK